MRIFMMSLTAAASLAATDALAQSAVCTSLDKGDLSIGQTLSQAQQQQLREQAPVGALHCGRTSCTAAASEGVSYSWRRDGRIVGKTIEMSAPTTLPGWRGEIDQAFADRLGQAACTRFTVFDDELDGGRSMKSAPLRRRKGR